MKHVTNNKLTQHLLAAGAATLTLPFASLAQTSSDSGIAGLEEVVVTAQKREQRLQDVPMSVTAIGGKQLEQQGIAQFQDLLRSVPGVSFAGTEPGQSRYAIRGISTEASSPTVGVYLDDISLVSIFTNFSGAFDPAFFDFERVEVLKGPQGTLYGGSAMGGAIKYVTRRPVFDETTFDTAAGFSTTRGGDPSYEAEGVANIPLIDGKLALRGGVLYRETGGYVDNVPNGTTQSWTRSATQPPAPFEPVSTSTLSTYSADDFNDRELLALRLAAKFAATDAIEIIPAVFYQRSDKANPDSYFTNLPDFTTSYRFKQPTVDETGVYSITAAVGLGAVDLTSITAYSTRKIGWDRDYSLFIGNLVPAFGVLNSYNTSDTTTKTFTQEVRLSSAPNSGRLQWVAGLFYADQRDQLLQTVTTVGIDDAIGLGTDVTYFGDQKTDGEQYAAFGDITYSVLPQLDVTVGLRYFEAKATVNGNFDGLFNGGPSAVDGKKSKDTGFTPKVSLSYRVTDDNLLYTSASKGFRQGGPNRFNTSSPLCAPDFERLGIDRVPDSYESDSLWTYELGSKNQLADRTTTVNAAVYYTKWDEIQQQVNLPACGFQFVGNVGAAEVKGAELAIESAITDWLSLGGTASYTDTEITESAPGVSAQVGQPVLDTPEWSGNVYGDLNFNIGTELRASLRAEYQYRDSTLRQFDTTAIVSYPDGSTAALPLTTQVQQSYDLVNLNFTIFRDRWQYRAYVNNVLDDAPYISFDRNAGESSVTTLRPRTIGVGVRVGF